MTVPTFTGELSQTVTIDAPADAVCKHFMDLAAIADATDDLEKWTDEGDHTMRLDFKEQKGPGVQFKGYYTVKYTRADDGTVTWSSTGQGNMRAQGKVTTRELGPTKTQVEYFEKVEVDMNINRMLARVARPLVESTVRGGIKSFVAAMKKSLEAKR